MLVAASSTSDCFLGVAEVVSGSLTLDDSGAYTTLAIVTLDPTAGEVVTTWLEYTRGTAGGFLLAKMEWGALLPDGSYFWVYDTTPTGSVTVSGATITTPVALTIGKGPVPADGSPVRFEFTWNKRSGATHARLSVAEAAASAATPGTVSKARLGQGGVR